jgi:hypothetical protein
MRPAGVTPLAPVATLDERETKMEDTGLKWCSRCGETKLATEFHVRHASNDGRVSRCKQCIAAYDREYFSANSDRLRAQAKNRYGATKHQVRVKQMRRMYDLTIAEYDAMRDAQDNQCAICGRHERDLNKRLCVDHDHETGRVRGLLCNQCNSLLGRWNDDPAIARRAAAYLEAGAQTELFGVG